MRWLIAGFMLIGWVATWTLAAAQNDGGLVPFESSEHGLAGMAPADWQQIRSGMSRRGAGDMDRTVLTIQSFPGQTVEPIGTQ